MRISLQRGLKVNMGNYEHEELSAHVTLDEADFEEDELEGLDRDERMALLQKTARTYMDDYLEPELRRAAGLSQATASMLIDPEPAPRRTERTTRRRSSR